MGVPADAPITVQFDRPVVPQTVIGRFSVTPSIPHCSLTDAFAAGPSAPCSIHWLAGDTGFELLHPGGVLLADKQYTFTLRGGFADPDGVVNTVDHSWNITTGSAPEIRGILPSGGATGVPADLPLTVTFSTPMAIAATSAAITLDPAVPGTRVVRNPQDHTRFLVLPGSPLHPGVSYRLSVSGAATDVHGLALASPASSSFVAGPMSGGDHAVVLAAVHGQAPSRVVTAALAEAEIGDPFAAETVLSAPLCGAASACGAAGAGAPLYTYSAAALSPNGAWLAVVETDATSARGPSALLVLNPATGAVADLIPGATLPSWSPDSTVLAYSQAGKVALYRPASATTTVLPAGDAVVRPPAWGPAGELLVLETAAAAGGNHVELADGLVAARYPVPGLSGEASNAALSPDGSTLALYRQAAPDTGTWVVAVGRGSGAPLHRLDADITPLAWTDPGTLLAISTVTPGHPQLVTVSVSADSQAPIVPAPPAAALDSISVASSGRLFAYLATSLTGAVQAEVESVDGGSPLPVTDFSSAQIDARSVTLS